MEHGPVEIVSFPMKKMVIVQSYVNVYQRETSRIPSDITYKYNFKIFNVYHHLNYDL